MRAGSASEGRVRRLLEVEDLHVRYGAFEAVKGVSFTLDAGEILGIVGESGSGKSTIARALIGLEKPAAGSIRYGFSSDGPQAKGRRRRITDDVQMIFQDAVGSLNPRMTVRQTLEETIRVAGASGARAGAEHLTVSTPEGLLSLVGLSGTVLEQYPREMSGGQCQRVSVARALARRPKVLIADEPVSALDVSVQARVLNLLRDLRRDLELSIVLIAHDLAVVKNICDRVCVMQHGLFVDAGAAGDVFANPKSDYTKHLLSVVPKIPSFLV